MTIRSCAVPLLAVSLLAACGDGTATAPDDTDTDDAGDDDGDDDDDTANDTGDTASAFDTSDTASAFDTGDTASAFDTGDTASAFDTGDTAIAFDTGDTASAFDTGDTASAYDTGDTAAAIDTGDTAATIDTGDTAAAIDTGDTASAFDTGDTGASSGPDTTLTKLWFGATFGFDADTQQVSPVWIDGVEHTSYLYGDLGTDDWDGDPQKTSQYCTVFMLLDGLEAQDWAHAEQRWLGIDFDGGTAFDDCAGFDAILQDDDPLAYLVEGIQYGIAIGGELDPFAVNSLEHAYGQDEMYRFWGATIESTHDSLQFVGAELAFSYGYQVEAGMNALLDGGDLVPTDKDDAPQGASVASGYYTVTSLVVWTFSP